MYSHENGEVMLRLVSQARLVIRRSFSEGGYVVKRLAPAGGASLTLALFGLSLMAWAAEERPKGLAPGKEPKQAAIVAEVNGQLITAQALEEKAAPGLLRVERLVYQAKREYLDKLIDDLLIQQEAKRRGVSKDKLVAEVKDIARIPVSDEELEEFYDDNEELFPEGKEAAREKILRLAREEKAAEKLEEFADALRAKAKIAIFLSPPSAPRQKPSSEAQKEPPKQSVPASPTKAPAGVVAEVNGVAITAKALEGGVKGRLAGFQKTTYETRKAALDEMIGEALVEQEAKKQGVSKEELFESVTGASKLTIPSEQVEAIYRRVRSRKSKEDEQKLKDRITQGLRRQQALPKWKEFIESLKARATIKTSLKAPAP